MTTEADRMARAGNYVLGLMDDADRERAERDLEIDPAFRDAVVRIAERMHMFDLDPPPEAVSEGLWKTIAARIAEMPQMRLVLEGERERPGQPPGSTDANAESVARGQTPVAPAPKRRALMIIAGLLAAFAAGYLTAMLRFAGWPV